MSDEMEDVTDLIRAYREKKKDGTAIPNPGMEKVILELMAKIKKEDRERIIEWIYKNTPANFSLDYKRVETAMVECGVSIDTGNSQAIKWTCDACGLVFSYRQGARYEDRHDRDIHPSCPRCGLDPDATMTARHQQELQKGQIPYWYEHEEEVERDGKKVKIAAGYKQRFITSLQSRKGSWIFSKEEDDRFEAERQRAIIDKMKLDARVEALAAAKHAPELLEK